MSGDNVKVNPGTKVNAINVATDEVDEVHYPIYKTAVGGDGEATLVDDDNPIPIKTIQTDAITSKDATLFSLLDSILKELKLTNMYMSEIVGDKITQEDIE